MCHQLTNQSVERRRTQSLRAHIREVSVGRDPNGVDNLSCNGLSNKIVGDSDMLLLQLRIWDRCTLDQPKIVPIQICGVGNGNAQTTEHVAE